MRIRILLGGALVFLVLRCANDDAASDGGDANGGSSGAGEAGDGGNAAGGTQGGSSGSGQAGESQGGMSGSGTSGTSGTTNTGGQDSTAGESGAGGSGGQDDGLATVSGRVTMPLGTPIEGVVIAIGTTTVGTDANGSFEIEDVAPTYDLVLINESEHFARVLRGLTARSLHLLGGGADPSMSATIRGVVTGGTLPVPTGNFREVAFQGPNRAGTQFLGRVVGSTPGYSFITYWYDAPSVSGTIYALETVWGTGTRALDYTGFGAKAFRVSNGGVFGATDGSTPATTVALRSVSERTVSGELGVPSGYDPVLWFSVGPFLVDIFDEPAGPYSTLLPADVPELSSYVQVHAERDHGTLGVEVSESTFLLPSSDDSVDLSTGAAPTSLLPVDAAVGVGYDTNFTWSQAPNSVSSFAVAVGGWLVLATSTASTGRIPNLEAYGIGLPAGGEGAWQVNVVFDSTVDQWVEFDSNNLAYVIENGRGGWSTGLARTFSVAD